MGLIVTLTTIVLAAHFILANPHALTKKATLPETSSLAVRQNGDSWTLNTAWCSSALSEGSLSELSSELQDSTAFTNFNGLSFCSEFLQPTVYSWLISTVTISTTLIYQTTITVATVSQTSTDLRPTTTTEYCAIPSSSAACATPALGFAMYQLGEYPSETDSTACQQLCLQDSKCNSIMLGRGLYVGCWTFNTTVVGYAMNSTTLDSIGAGTPYPLMWDRDCQDILPAECRPTSSPIPAVAKNKRYAPIPDFLSAYNWYDFLDVCTCLITSASPTFTFTQTPAAFVYSSTSTTITTTEIDQFYETPSLTTVYKTIA